MISGWASAETQALLDASDVGPVGMALPVPHRVYYREGDPVYDSGGAALTVRNAGGGEASIEFDGVDQLEVELAQEETFIAMLVDSIDVVACPPPQRTVAAAPVAVGARPDCDGR